MRKLLLGALLTASLPTFAGVFTDAMNSNNGNIAKSYQEAAAACTSDTCEADIAQEMLEAGISAEMIMAAVIDSGVPAVEVIRAAADAAFQAGVDVNDVMAAAAKVPGVKPSEVVQGVATAATTNNIPVADVMEAAISNNIPDVQTIAGIAQAGVSAEEIKTAAASEGVEINPAVVDAGLNVASNNGNNNNQGSTGDTLTLKDNIIVQPGGDSEA